jgi:hypothetical protein
MPSFFNIFKVSLKIVLIKYSVEIKNNRKERAWVLKKISVLNVRMSPTVCFLFHFLFTVGNAGQANKRYEDFYLF